MSLGLYIELENNDEQKFVFENLALNENFEEIENLTQTYGVTSLDEMTAMEFDHEASRNDQSLWLSPEEGLEWVETMLHIIQDLSSDQSQNLENSLVRLKEVLQSAKLCNARWRFRIDL